MPEPSFAEQMATLNSTLRAIEVRLAFGRPPVEGLEDFKGALDDMRLRLWGLLSTAGGEDHKLFQQRFRIRRATELCRALKADLRGGEVSPQHPDLPGLREAVSELDKSIEHARHQAF
jgi:hypothetical protein